MATYPPTISQLPAIFNPNEFYKEETGVGTLEEVLTEGNDGNNLGIVNGGAITCASLGSPFGSIQALDASLIDDIGTTGLAIVPNGTLKLKGCFDKGSILAGDGSTSVELPVGANGLFLKTNSGASSGLEWASNGDVNSVVAGTNISVSGTTDPVVSIKSPLDATLDIGNQLVQGNSADVIDPTIVSSIGLQTTNGSIASLSLISNDPNISGGIDNGAFLTTNNTSSFLSLASQSGGGSNNYSYLNTADAGGILENINLTASKFATRIMSDAQAGSGITFGDGSTFLNITQDIVNASGCSSGITYQNPVSGRVVSTNQQVNSAQNLNTYAYNDAGGFITYTQVEADNAKSRVRCVHIPSTGGQQNIGSFNTNSAGCSLRQDVGAYNSEISTAVNTCNITHNVASSLLQINTTQNSSTINQTADNSAGGGSVSYQQNVGTTNFSINSQSASGTAITCSTPLSVNTGSFITNTSGRVGAVSQPSFVFDSANATAGSYPAIKIDRSSGNYSAGDTLGAISMWGRDSAGTSREWSRLQTKTENVGASNQDATLSIFNSVNGVVSETFNFNGGQNENNSFRPLDMNGNNIRTSSGNLTIDTTASTGPGILTLSALQSVLINSGGGSNIALNTSSGNFTLNTGTTGGIQLTGTALTSGSAGGNSGLHLVITINGTPYKIQLLNN